MEDLSCLTPKRIIPTLLPRRNGKRWKMEFWLRYFAVVLNAENSLKKLGEAVVIDEVVAGIAPNSTPALLNGKDVFYNGLHNYTDERGRLYGRSRSVLNMRLVFISRNERKCNPCIFCRSVLTHSRICWCGRGYDSEIFQGRCDYLWGGIETTGFYALLHEYTLIEKEGWLRRTKWTNFRRKIWKKALY